MTAAQTTPALKEARPGLPDRIAMGIWKPLLVFVLFSLTITAGGNLAFQYYKETFTAEKQGDLGGIADLKIGQIVTWMAARRSDAQALTNDTLFTASAADWLRRGGRAGEDRAKLEARLTSLQQAYADYGYTSVLLFDDKAKLRLSSRVEATPVPAMETELLLESMRTGQIVFSDIHRERHHDGESVEIDLVAPLFGGKNDPLHPIGAIFIRIDAQHFLFPLIQHWPTPSASAENLLVRREGDEVVFLNELRHRKNSALDMRLPLTAKLPAAMAVLGKEGMVNGVDYRGVPVVGILSKVPGTSWKMVSKIDKAEIYAPIDRLANWMSLLMLSLVGAGGGIAFCWRRKELKQHQNELDHQARFQRSERSLAEAQRLAHLGSWELDLTNNALIWSDENYRIFEIDPEKFGASYEAFLNIIHPDDRDWVNKAYTDSVRDKVPYNIVHRLQMQDGRIKYINEICETYYDEDGKPLRSIGTTHDITGRKLAEIRFEREHNRLRTLVQTIPDLVWLKDVNGMYLGCNSQFERLFGVKEAEIIGKSDFDLIDAKMAEHFRQKDREAMDAGTSRVNEEWVTFPGTGQRMLLETIKTPLRDESGQVIGVIGIARDITERKQAERDLERQKTFMWQVMDTDPNQIFVKDIEGNFLLANQSAAAAHGMTPSEMIGKNLAEIIHSPDEAAGYLQTDREVIETGADLNLVELHTLPDGEQRWMLTIKRRLTMPDGKLGTLGIAVDITEQKLAEMELAESYRELQRLALYLENVRADEREKIALNLHDEMGATLVAIKMGVAWLASKLPAETPRLSTEAARISELVSGGIQTMRRIVTQLRPNLLADVGLEAAIRDYVEKFSQHTNIECILNLPDEDLALDAEQALTLFRILQESLNNVAKHAQTDRVNIHFTAQEESLSMVIKDNGIGFDPTAHKDQSFGLLGIRERALMVGGKARISSAPGKGTRVSVSIPVSHQCMSATAISSHGVES